MYNRCPELMGVSPMCYGVSRVPLCTASVGLVEVGDGVIPSKHMDFTVSPSHQCRWDAGSREWEYQWLGGWMKHCPAEVSLYLSTGHPRPTWTSTCEKKMYLRGRPPTRSLGNKPRPNSLPGLQNFSRSPNLVAGYGAYCMWRNRLDDTLEINEQTQRDKISWKFHEILVIGRNFR